MIYKNIVGLFKSIYKNTIDQMVRMYLDMFLVNGRDLTFLHQIYINM